MSISEPPILRRPTEHDLNASLMARYRDWLADQGWGRFDDYGDLHAWSIEHPRAFWASLWTFLGIRARRGYDTVMDEPRMPGTSWFPGARLNYAENLLAEAIDGDPDRVALDTASESAEREIVTYGELAARVAAMRAWLAAAGVGSGDRVAAVVTNTPEAVVAMLATVSLGAIWSSASPDFGVDALADRFEQIAPCVLIAVDGYRYGGRDYDCDATIDALVARLPAGVELVIVPRRVGAPAPASPHTDWRHLMADYRGASLAFEPVAFDHPAFILYSSGTTGAPKCIVHSGGGALLQHAKELMLHADVTRESGLFYYTTTGWMMWNWLVSGLATGCRLVLYDGAPAHRRIDACWALAAERGVTHFGTSARYIGACRHAAIAPGRDLGLAALRTVMSTGSPLLPEDFDWLVESVGADVHIASLSGGTDIIGCFVGPCPLLPVWRGEIQCPILGMDVAAYDETGKAVISAPGELVCRQPAPSMPVYFYNDDDGSRYRSTYFETFPGVWAHGDWITMTERGSAIIHGRSDATLNPGGVRLGTAEIYRQVETLEAVADSLAVDEPAGDDVRVVLLVVLEPGSTLDDELADIVRRRIRAGASPRHVPARIVAVDAIPYTRNGKKVEVAVARLLRGQPVGNRAALANPESLDALARHAELTASRDGQSSTA
jgi:acetoacetyl-CoA synthetase